MAPRAAAFWDERPETGRIFSDAERLAFYERVGVRPGMVAVDAGCGVGVVARQLHAWGVAATGIDVSPEAVAAARRMSPHGVRYVTTPVIGQPAGQGRRAAGLSEEQIAELMCGWGAASRYPRGQLACLVLTKTAGRGRETAGPDRPDEGDS